MRKSSAITPSVTGQLDYAQWLSRAWNFIDKCRTLPDSVSIDQIVEPPATRKELQTLSSSLVRPLPRSLVRWFREGSIFCELTYHWRPQAKDLSPLQRKAAFEFSVGGCVKMGPLAEVEVWFELCDLWSEPLMKERDRRSKQAEFLWRNSFPFCTYGDGDMLGILPSEDGPEPVTYLIHDSPADSFVIAPDFDEFLRIWEQLRYCDQNGIFFFTKNCKSPPNPSSKAAQQLREWLPPI